jgi:hypothetical protein
MKNSVRKDRNIKLDIIRFTGVLIIMVAHSNPPEWLFQLRNFGTPLLILGSALTYSFIYKHKTINKGEFFRKRLTRLIIPLWLFLTFFFLFYWIISLVIEERSFPFSTMDILNSYNLYSGISYIWIFKIYILLALITPLGLKLSYSSMNNRTYFISIIIVYIVYELAMHLFFNSIPDSIKEFITQYFLIIIPYSVLFLYGLRLHTISNTNLLGIIISSLLLFAVLAFQKYTEAGEFVPTQNYKYPPTLYYLSYAFFWINVIYFLVSKYVTSTQTKIKKTIIWLSSNSLWIYLWHIFAAYVYYSFMEETIGNHFGTFTMFLIKACFLLSFGTVMTYIQITQVDKLLLKNNTTSKKALLLLK